MEKWKTTSKGCLNPAIQCSTVYNSQDMEAVQVPISRQLAYEDVVYTRTHTGILLRHKKNEILPFVARWMDVGNIMLSEVRQRQIPNNVTYIWNLKNNTNEYKTETGSQT